MKQIRMSKEINKVLRSLITYESGYMEQIIVRPFGNAEEEFNEHVGSIVSSRIWNTQYEDMGIK